MKYWRGYLTAVIFFVFAWALKDFAASYPNLVDMIYPYVTRMLQGLLAGWTGNVDFLVWQVLVLLFVAFVLVSLVLMIIWRRNIVQWLGWVLALVSVVYCLHTGIYGLNYYAGDLATDLKMEVTVYTASDLEEATIYYRDQANELSTKVNRDENGVADFAEFEVLADQTGNGFRSLVLDYQYSVFGGEYTPVKKLGWAGMYTAMGITGFTCFLTGEAAVNPRIPDVMLPFTMSHEMAHRLCVAQESEANFAAFLACMANESVEYQYSAYFMAYRYCSNALSKVDATAATRVKTGCTNEMLTDMRFYSNFFSENKDQTAADIANTVNDTYLKTSGDTEGVASYGLVSDLLVNWYTGVVNADVVEEEPNFDPYDESQVDLTTTGVDMGAAGDEE